MPCGNFRQDTWNRRSTIAQRMPTVTYSSVADVGKLLAATGITVSLDIVRKDLERLELFGVVIRSPHHGANGKQPNLWINSGNPIPPIGTPAPKKPPGLPPPVPPPAPAKPKPRTQAQGAVTAARRALIVEVLRSKSQPMTVTEMLGELLELHQRGEWPTGGGLKPAPYNVGVRQHLDRLRYDGEITGESRNVGGVRAFYYEVVCPEDLLPREGVEARFVLDAVHAFAARTGCDVIVGISDDNKRVIQVDTLRGAFQYELVAKQSWEEGLRDVGII